MEQPVPMDRLICGDVGYGKTEIAVRAAFKAVQDGKQVAVLVPDDAARAAALRDVRRAVRQLPGRRSARCRRFQTDKEAEADHARASPTAPSTSSSAPTGCSPATSRFKDLGLVVVDEEQRFGVEHKEQLKQLRTNVDVLTMSATPIPRTLEMAITGIREMSTIQTPPEERHPVLTFVGAYDEKQVAAAIRRELLREGQVFYVHNRVESIDRAAARLRELVPEARIAVAHGQMNEHALEQVDASTSGSSEFDVLVCTTIVEIGPRHRQRQHADRRAGRHARPVPAAPAARPGRPRPRARLRLLPLPAREAADRDRARPAGDDRAAHRPRRRHARSR